MSKQLALEQKVNYMRLALNLQQIGLQEEIIDSIVSTYDALLLKGGDLNLEDITQIQFDVKERHTKAAGKECSKHGIKKEGESCTLNDNCIYPKCLE